MCASRLHCNRCLTENLKCSYPRNPIRSIVRTSSKFDSRPRGSPRPSLRHAAISSLIILLAFGGIIGVGELRALVSTSPNITLEKADVSQSGCLPPPDLIYLFFGLNNSGNADGYGRVALFVNGTNYWARTYTVRASTTLRVEETVALACNHPGHGFDLRLLWTGRIFFSV